MNRADEIKLNLEQAMREVRLLEQNCDYYKAEYERVYKDLGRLGEALGYVNCARPQSPAALMAEWVEEVRALVAKYEPERHKRMEDEKEQAWRLS